MADPSLQWVAKSDPRWVHIHYVILNLTTALPLRRHFVLLPLEPYYLYCCLAFVGYLTIATAGVERFELPITVLETAALAAWPHPYVVFFTAFRSFTAFRTIVFYSLYARKRATCLVSLASGPLLRPYIMILS